MKRWTMEPLKIRGSRIDSVPGLSGGKSSVRAAIPERVKRLRAAWVARVPI